MSQNHWWTDPADTFDERLVQYVGALIEYGRTEYRIHDLNLRGHKWTTCTRMLARAGMMENEGRIKWFRVLATGEELAAWVADR